MILLLWFSNTVCQCLFARSHGSGTFLRKCRENQAKAHFHFLFCFEKRKWVFKEYLLPKQNKSLKYFNWSKLCFSQISKIQVFLIIFLLVYFEFEFSRQNYWNMKAKPMICHLRKLQCLLMLFSVVWEGKDRLFTCRLSLSTTLRHGVWKSQKKSHSTLRAKRATFTFWVDKS